jgi:hypothetical protein
MNTWERWFLGRGLPVALSMCWMLGASLPGAEVKTPRPPIKPTSGVPQSATPRAVCTFESIGLYWTPADGAEDRTCQVHYHITGEQAWREALPLWFDKRIGEYRGSIVQLRSGSRYEVRLALAGTTTSRS